MLRSGFQPLPSDSTFFPFLALGSYALMFGLIGMIPTPPRVGSLKSHRAY